MTTARIDRDPLGPHFGFVEEPIPDGDPVKRKFILTRFGGQQAIGAELAKTLGLNPSQGGNSGGGETPGSASM